jgi:hypothetical protein
MNSKPSLSPIHIFVDVDDTLVRSAGTKRIPMPSVIEHVRTLHTQGATLFCWSAGGADYARSSAVELGIADCFTGFLPKPNVMIDDQAMSAWPRCMMVHPSSCGDRTLDDYNQQLNGHAADSGN